MLFIDFIYNFMCFVFRRAHLRNVSGLPSVLRRQPIRDLREDPERSRGVASTPGSRRQRYHQEVARAGQDQKAGKYEGIHRILENFYFLFCTSNMLQPTIKQLF